MGICLECPLATVPGEGERPAGLFRRLAVTAGQQTFLRRAMLGATPDRSESHRRLPASTRLSAAPEFPQIDRSREDLDVCAECIEVRREKAGTAASPPTSTPRSHLQHGVR